MDREDLIHLFDSVDIGYVMFDSDHRIIFHNQQAKQLFKTEKLEHFSQLPLFVQEIVGKWNRDGNRLPTKIDRYRMHLKSFHWKGQDVSLLSVVEDIEYNELELIIRESFDEILVTDRQGTIKKISARCEELYGMPAERLIGKKTSELAHDAVFTPSLTPLVLQEKKKVSGIQMTKTGKKLYVIGNPIFDDEGEIYRIVFNSREYSEIEALESRLLETEDLLNKYREELNQLKQIVSDQKPVIYNSKEMNQVYQIASKVAQVDSTVLIVGETGVGKGMMARYIHQESSRSKNKLIEVNCGAIPENLIESELFGYERGAFTGANKEGKKGVIELADKGTLFLDEIGELPLSTQVKLLQFLQDNTFRRVGGSELIQVDTRIIAATNQELPRLVKEKKFREDFYYRLNVVPITIPPLRHRSEDISILIQFFVSSFNSKYGLHKQLHEDIYPMLCQYAWPGNVRELENLIERLLVTCDGNIVKVEELPSYLLENNTADQGIVVKSLIPLKEAVEQLEKKMITMAYETYKNTYKCAEVLEVNQSTVVRKMKKYLEDGGTKV
ncbi:sigma 54-interacting transcriptional regulator [Ammoniphilus sp. CFH 90114]|uniref:sigma 54-interacting transcriptional regulator n=1 Tax=Ammoniphilus sp. CFH 90114 TaxID=2493665 RepID=UPI00100FFCEE|nr:sigma 54-interacting transcriptional regulator [Ammoniphilus sp. CFH 90114]RXT08763.1 PAS domain S-box protein [Ammoniphilus sp. CFH 90114]